MATNVDAPTKNPTDELALITLPEMNLPTPAFISETLEAGFGKIYKDIEDEIASTNVDPNTKKGRDALKSLAHKISRMKVALDDKAKALTEDQRAITKAVNDQRNSLKSTMDEKRDRVKAPVLKWEAAEKERSDKIEAAFDRLINIKHTAYDGVDYEDMGSEALLELAAEIFREEPREGLFGGLLEEYNTKRFEVIKSLKARADKIAAEEADRKELEEMRQARAEREAKEEADRLAAEEADRVAARKKADDESEAARQAQAKKEADEAAAAKIAAEKDRTEKAEKARVAAEAEALAAKDQAELDRKAAEKREADLAAEREADRIAAEAREKLLAEQAEEKRLADIATEKAASEERARKSAKEADERQRLAVKAERDRAHKAASDKAAADEQRARDQDHIKNIKNDAMIGVLKVLSQPGGNLETTAQAIVTAIAAGDIPNVKISY